MKLLIDNALSPAIASILNEGGYETKHVRDFDIQHADDETIFQFAEKNEFTIVSADTDFGTLLAMRNSTKPSVIIFRRSTDRHPTKQGRILLKNFNRIEKDLTEGAIVVFDRNRIRIRKLPINR